MLSANKRKVRDTGVNVKRASLLKESRKRKRIKRLPASMYCRNVTDWLKMTGRPRQHLPLRQHKSPLGEARFHADAALFPAHGTCGGSEAASTNDPLRAAYVVPLGSAMSKAPVALIPMARPGRGSVISRP